MSKEIPILFSTPMVQAILYGRKTQTRRMNGLNKVNDERPEDFTLRSTDGLASDDGAVIFHNGDYSSMPFKVYCPYGKPGDLLWVRETFVYRDKHDKYYYKADHIDHEPYAHNGWKPSIHMPKTASRIWLEITGVRVERLHDMDGATANECDSLKEGIMAFHHGDGNYGYHWKGDMDGDNFNHPYDAFKDLWQSINGEESWKANPWVWVIEFKVLSTTGKP